MATNIRIGAPVTALTATLGLAAACWVVTVRQMSGMDMGVASTLGSFGSFGLLWVPMMAAMMLPGAVPAVFSRADATGRASLALRFVASYLAVWAAAGVVVYVFYRPHGTVAAGALVIAAGIYEASPLKQRFRGRCRENLHSGLEFGLTCAGSSVGLMVILVALGVMSVPWMAAIALVVVGQKLLPANTAADLLLALAIVGFGVLVILAPSSVPGLMPSM